MKFLTTTLTTLAASFLATSASSAAMVMYHGTFTVTGSGTVSAAQIATGDRFYYQFTINTSAVDSNSSTSYAQFNNLFSDYRFMAAATNTGTWNPAASGTWSTNGTGFADNGQLRVIFNGAGFQSLTYTQMGPPPMGGTKTTTSVTTNPTYNVSFNDTGAGQSFSQMFGTLSPNSVIPYLSVGTGGGAVPTTSNTFGQGAHPMMVPEPSAALLLGCGALTVVLHRRRSN